MVVCVGGGECRGGGTVYNYTILRMAYMWSVNVVETGDILSGKTVLWGSQHMSLSPYYDKARSCPMLMM